MIGFSELLLLCIVILLVLSPKHLPQTFYYLGQLWSKGRRIKEAIKRTIQESDRNSTPPGA